MLAGSRITHHLKECNHHNYHHHRQLGYGLGLGLGFCYTKTSISVSDKRLKNPSSFSQSSTIDFGLGPPFVSCIQSKSPSGEIPILPGAFSQREDDREPPSDRLSSVAGGIVALGKFDALHIGHRELAIQAAKVGVPFLLSFVGMAQVLGWEPRAPIVAKCDRKRVLSSWAPYCGNLTPTEFEVQFSKVRYLSPRQFVEKLSKKLGVRGVVAGKNYRFGFRAAGDASELVTLCEEYGLGAYIIDSVMDKNKSSIDTCTSDSKDQGQVSSTRVRQALAKGNMKYVSELLGRQHRLILTAKDGEITSNRTRISAPKSCLLNLPPKEDQYENCYLLAGDDNVKPCRVVIDMSHIHLDLDEVSTCNYITSQDFQFLGIEFGQSEV